MRFELDVEGCRAAFVLDQLRKSENSVQGHSQFMAHARQKLGLGGTRALGRFLFSQRALGNDSLRCPVGDIDGDAEDEPACADPVAPPSGCAATVAPKALRGAW